MGFHRNNVICLKIATSLNKSRNCSIMSIYCTIKFQYSDKNLRACLRDLIFFHGMFEGPNIFSSILYISMTGYVNHLKTNPTLFKNVNRQR